MSETLGMTNEKYEGGALKRKMRMCVSEEKGYVKSLITVISRYLSHTHTQ